MGGITLAHRLETGKEGWRVIDDKDRYLYPCGAGKIQEGPW